MVFRRQGFITFSNYSSGTKESTYAETENQLTGDSTFQELSVTTGKELTASKSENVRDTEKERVVNFFVLLF